MADVGNAATQQPVVKFSVGEDTVSVDIESPPTNDGQGDGIPPRSASRFKVAKVEFVDEAASDSDPCGTPPPAANGVVPRDGARVRDRLNSESTLSHHPTEATYSYDTNNLKTFGHNTLETLPHADHYRNLLSATGAMMRKRPTLLELHEHDKDVSESCHDSWLIDKANRCHISNNWNDRPLKVR